MPTIETPYTDGAAVPVIPVTPAQFGLRAEWRRYRCAVCDTATTISTNHTSTCYNWCASCSWKCASFAPGLTMDYGGRALRLHAYAGEVL